MEVKKVENLKMDDNYRTLNPHGVLANFKTTLTLNPTHELFYPAHQHRRSLTIVQTGYLFINYI